MIRFQLRPGVRRVFRLPLRSLEAIHADVDAELESLITNRADALVARGMAPSDARAEALRRLGVTLDDARRQLHQSAEQREHRMKLREQFESLMQDVRYAARGLALRPAFTAVAVVTLAIGIGATTAIFSAVNVLLLRSLPYARPDELMRVTLVTPQQGTRTGTDQMVWSYPKFVAFRDVQHVFSELALYTAAQFTIGSSDVERVSAEFVGATYFRVLGLSPVRGRDFDRQVDAAPGAAPQAILSYTLWERRFNADPSIVGRSIDVNHKPYTVVGIAPRSFFGLTGESQLFVPITDRNAAELNQPQSHEFWLVARRAPGISLSQAKGAVAVLGRRVSDAFPNQIDKLPWGATAAPLNDARLAPRVKRSLLILFGAVSFVLLIACVNVANLLLGRASTRRREIAVRLAIGAGRGRLVRLLLAEGVMLSLAGAAASLVVAWAGVRALGRVDPATALRVSTESGLGAVAFSPITLDWRALGFALGVSLFVGIVFGLVPALGATRGSLTDALKDGSARSRDGAPTSVGRRGLVVAEVALALILLAGSGLMIHSLSKLLAINPGYDGRNVLTFRIGIPPDGLPRDSMPAFYDRIDARLRALPGVTDVALGNCAPLSGGCSTAAIQFHDRPATDLAHAPSIGVHWATPNWFSALRVPLRRGRLISDSDRFGAPLVVVINDVAAQQFWPAENPIGKRVGITMGGFDDAEVIGVVGSVRVKADSSPRPEVYVAFAQSPRPGMMVFLRSARDANRLTPDVRRVMHDVAPQLPIYDLRTMDDRASGATAQARFTAMLLGLFALTALSLAAVGIYGVMSLVVTARTREIGIRVALGADRGRVQRLVLGESALLAGMGGIIGLAGALAATRVLRSVLFDLAPTDPVTYVTIVALLAATVGAASWIPARRASRVDPVVALRAD